MFTLMLINNLVIKASYVDNYSSIENGWVKVQETKCICVTQSIYNSMVKKSLVGHNLGVLITNIASYVVSFSCNLRYSL